MDNSQSVSNTRTYIPPRIVLSSEISRQDLNTKETDTVETEKLDVRDDVDDLFQKLSEQMHEKIKQSGENKEKLKLNKPLARKRKNFVEEFLDVKKRFEEDLAANSRIYHNSSMSLANSETLRDINNEEYKLQKSSADEYMKVLQSQKTAQSDSLNKAVNKYYSLQSCNWVPGAAVTKLKLDSESNSNNSTGEIKNQELSQNSNLNDRGRKIRDKVNIEELYGITYKFSQAPTKAKSKKKSFIEEFDEFRNKLGTTSKNKIRSHEENLEKMNTEIKDREALNPNLKQDKKTEKINKKIVTPFPGIRTSFFSNNNNSNESAKSNRKKRSEAKKADITADWVKGDEIQRKGHIFNYIDSKNREQTPERMYESEDSSIEEKQEFNFTPINKHIRMSPSYTPDFHTSDASTYVDFTPENRKSKQTFKNHCTSAVTMSTVQYSKNINIQHGLNRSKCVITETKVTNLIFPTHQMKMFQRR